MTIINPNNYETLVGIDDEVLTKLTKLARPFVDDPNAVLRRELYLDEAEQPSHNGAAAPPNPSVGGVHRRSREPTRTTRRKPPRAPKGSLTPEGAFEVPILASLAEAGGALPFRDAMAAVGQRMELVLNDHDRFTDEKGVARWEKRVPFVRLRLVQQGLLDPEAPRGIWRLTDAGREALAERAAVDAAGETTE